jgi:hypothetical protein
MADSNSWRAASAWPRPDSTQARSLGQRASRGSRRIAWRRMFSCKSGSARRLAARLCRSKCWRRSASEPTAGAGSVAKRRRASLSASSVPWAEASVAHRQAATAQSQSQHERPPGCGRRQLEKRSINLPSPRSTVALTEPSPTLPGMRWMAITVRTILVGWASLSALPTAHGMPGKQAMGDAANHGSARFKRRAAIVAFAAMIDLTGLDAPVRKAPRRRSATTGAAMARCDHRPDPDRRPRPVDPRGHLGWRAAVGGLGRCKSTTGDSQE